MIAKAVKGQGFRGALDYDLTKEQGKILDTNMAGVSPRELAAEFGEIRRLRPNLGKAVLQGRLQDVARRRCQAGLRQAGLRQERLRQERQGQCQERQGRCQGGP